MTVLVAWVLLPGILCLLALGFAGLLERLTGEPLERALLLPVGIAALIVVAQVPVAIGLEGLTTPLVVLLAVAGLVLSRSHYRGLPERWAAGLGLLIFAVYAAPVVLAGSATFAGFIKLDDTATWLALTDQVMERGLDLSALAPSSFEATLAFNLGDGYPYGVFLPLGIGSELTGTDAAWLIQPYMALLGVALYCSLWSLARPVIERAWLRATVAFVAAQPALLYGIYLWGGVKEMLAAALLAATLALLVPAIEKSVGPRAMIAPAATMAALVGVLTPAGLAWLAPALLLAAVLIWLQRGTATIALGAALVGATAAMSLPVLLTGEFVPAVSDPLTSDALGNLFGPLSVTQIVGIWPIGDFRIRPDNGALLVTLIGVALFAAVWGAVALAARGAYGVLVYPLGLVTGSLLLFGLGSPWNGAKALAAGAPAVLFLVGCGIAAILSAGRRLEAYALGAIVAVGVLGSNALAYSEAWLAPRDQLTELEQVGDRFAGDGPALMTEYNPYGVRHFLRRLDPEGVSELRRRTIPLTDGGSAEKGEHKDTDALALDGLLTYRTLVLRRSPSASRPPFPYARVWEGEHYEVWQRPEEGAPDFGLVEHLGLGYGLDPAAVPGCDELRGLGERAPAGSRIVAAPGPHFSLVSLGELDLPPGWSADPYDSRLVLPGADGAVEATVEAPEAGRYEFWLGGSIAGTMRLWVDGELAGEARHVLNNSGQYIGLGAADLAEGGSSLKLGYEAGGMRPGAGARQESVGPLVFSRRPDGDRLLEAAPAAAERFCGKRLDWVAIVAG